MALLEPLATQLDLLMSAIPDCLWEGEGSNIGCLGLHWVWGPHAIFTIGRRRFWISPKAEGATEAPTLGGD